eukprot:g78759.t1
MGVEDELAFRWGPTDPRPCALCGTTTAAPLHGWGTDPLPYCGCDDNTWVDMAEAHIARCQAKNTISAREFDIMTKARTPSPVAAREFDIITKARTPSPVAAREFDIITKARTPSPVAAREFDIITKARTPSPVAAREFDIITKARTPSPVAAREFDIITKARTPSPVAAREFDILTKARTPSPVAARAFDIITKARTPSPVAAREFDIITKARTPSPIMSDGLARRARDPHALRGSNHKLTHSSFPFVLPSWITCTLRFDFVESPASAGPPGPPPARQYSVTVSHSPLPLAHQMIRCCEIVDASRIRQWPLCLPSDATVRRLTNDILQ